MELIKFKNFVKPYRIPDTSWHIFLSFISLLSFGSDICSSFNTYGCRKLQTTKMSIPWIETALNFLGTYWMLILSKPKPKDLKFVWNYDISNLKLSMVFLRFSMKGYHFINLKLSRNIYKVKHSQSHLWAVIGNNWLKAFIDKTLKFSNQILFWIFITL